jgi:hypothetical protein
MHSLRSDRQEGIALVTATIFLAVAAILLTAVSARTINQHFQVTHYTDYKTCELALDGAYATSRSALMSSGDGNVGLGSWTPGPAEGGVPDVPSFADDRVAPVERPTMPGVAYMSYTHPWDGDDLDNNGDGLVDGPEEQEYVTVYSLAQKGANTLRSEAVLRGRSLSVWDNAIFAGEGQAGGIIGGHTDIHGSVHILGNNLLDGSVAMGLIGNSGIYNNYDGCPAGLANRVPPVPLTVVNGETVQSLNAELRVRRGLISVSGSATIGTPDQEGNDLKEMMDGTYVNDGWTGNKTADDGGRGVPSVVHSDNGWDKVYDLGTQLDFPYLADEWRDPVTGEGALNATSGLNYTHEEYFSEVLGGTPYDGDLSINAGDDFYYNATRPGDTNPAHRLPTDDYMLFDAATNLLELNGQIEVDGNLSLERGKGSDRTINYTGRAAILVHGDVALETNLLAVNANGATADSFPVNNCLGIMASSDMHIGTNSQLELMGAFYAQGAISCDKQSTIMGTFVSNNFDMGTNVPSLFQVLSLADNLPLGMIGAFPLLSFEEISWRQL